MTEFHNLFTWEHKVQTDAGCSFQNCVLNVPMSVHCAGEKLDEIVQDYERSVFIIHTYMGETHIPYRVVCDSISSKYQDTDRVTETLLKRVEYLENR
jgi:hypothetical protein